MVRVQKHTMFVLSVRKWSESKPKALYLRAHKYDQISFVIQASHIKN